MFSEKFFNIEVLFGKKLLNFAAFLGKLPDEQIDLGLSRGKVGVLGSLTLSVVESVSRLDDEFMRMRLM